MNTQPSLTLVILTKNSASQLKNILPEYAPHNDQLILLDDSSTDTIKELAQVHQAELVSHRLQKDFAAHRNAVFSKVSSEWTLFLDADEYAPPAFWQELKTYLSQDTIDAISISRLDTFLGKTLHYGESGTNSFVRCARTEISKNRWERAVHEIWNVPTHRIAHLNTPIEHCQNDTVTSYLNKLHWYASLEATARTRYAQSQIFFELLTYPVAKFCKNFIVKQGWRDGFHGLIHALLMSYHSLITRVYLYEEWHT